MAKSVFSGSHHHLVAVLREARSNAALSQTALAERVGKRQRWVSLIESSDRRVDVLEFVALARALDRDPVELLRDVLSRLPDDLSI